MDVLDKTNFLNYLVCERYGWNVFHGKAPAIPEDSQRLYRAGQGEEVERLCRQLFPDGWEIVGERAKAVRQTEDLIREGRVANLYQATALSPDNLLAKADFTTVEEAGGLKLYEVKMVNNLALEKKSLPPEKERHLVDVTFQKIAFERSGYQVQQVFLVHINGDYRLRGETVDPAKFLKQVDVGREVAAREAVVAAQIEAAKRCYAGPEPPCRCRHKPKNRRCGTFWEYNTDIPTKNSILDISHIQVKKIENLLERKVLEIKKIDSKLSDEIGFSPKQRRQIEVIRSGEPFIDRKAVAESLQRATYPLYFLDYETINYPIPVFKGAKPFQQVAFQFSLHILEEEGEELRHAEYLMSSADEAELRRLIAELRAAIGSKGSIIVWYQAAEKSFHKSLTVLLPENRAFFADLDGRIFDLEKIFSSQHYVHPEMEGKTSLKKAVNILRDDYYGDLDIQEGSLASAAWNEALEASEEDQAKRFEQLRQYCRRDTLAMVDIYQHLRQLRV